MMAPVDSGKGKRITTTIMIMSTIRIMIMIMNGRASREDVNGYSISDSPVNASLSPGFFAAISRRFTSESDPRGHTLARRRL